MRARIGIADTGREIEVEIEGRDEIVELIDDAYRKGVPVLWFTNTIGQDIGVPLRRVAFIELVADPDQTVGFAS